MKADCLDTDRQTLQGCHVDTFLHISPKLNVMTDILTKVLGKKTDDVILLPEYYVKRQNTSYHSQSILERRAMTSHAKPHYQTQIEQIKNKNNKTRDTGMVIT
eukprot:TRINITY_DN23772_c0_g2_i1.p1 TRINITY_DN23772_c0_g2~~TRINITY_DN23772_c0_g2_i1.p1  ORF type:complete len:103 (+),score=10.96 TRINITY_DN23772_c0_g2_i1:67-375(+)